MSKGDLGILTAEGAVTVLTLPVFYLLSRQASVTFPTSTESHPSRNAIIERHTRVPDPDGTLPVTLVGTQYRQAVLPVLTDPLLEFDLPINKSDIKNYKDRIGHAIRKSFEDAGF